MEATHAATARNSDQNLGPHLVLRSSIDSGECGIAERVRGNSVRTSPASEPAAGLDSEHVIRILNPHKQQLGDVIRKTEADCSTAGGSNSVPEQGENTESSPLQVPCKPY